MVEPTLAQPFLRISWLNIDPVSMLRFRVCLTSAFTMLRPIARRFILSWDIPVLKHGQDSIAFFLGCRAFRCVWAKAERCVVVLIAI